VPARLVPCLRHQHHSEFHLSIRLSTILRLTLSIPTHRPQFRPEAFPQQLETVQLLTDPHTNASTSTEACEATTIQHVRSTLAVYGWAISHLTNRGNHILNAPLTANWKQITSTSASPSLHRIHARHHPGVMQFVAAALVSSLRFSPCVSCRLQKIG
jgi:hypothetical protein